MGILDSIKKIFGGGGSSESTMPEDSTPAPETPAVPETAAPEIGGGTGANSESGGQTPTA